MANIQVTITPSDATDKSFTVESDHPEIVRVDGTTCTALKAGQAVLTIKTNDGNKTAQCTVTVREAPKSVSAVSQPVNNVHIHFFKLCQKITVPG